MRSDRNEAYSSSSSRYARRLGAGNTTAAAASELGASPNREKRGGPTLGPDPLYPVSPMGGTNLPPTGKKVAVKAYTYLDRESHPILSPWGEALRHARQRAHLTEQALSELSGVPQPTISRNENGALCLPETREKLIDALGEASRLRRAWGKAQRARARELTDASPTHTDRKHDG